MVVVIKGILFDLDGVITDTAEFHYQAWKQLAKELNIIINRNFNEKLKGISRMESLNKILEYGNRYDDFTNDEKLKLTDKKNEHYIELIKTISSKDLLPGIKTLLKDSHAENIKMSIASASKNAPFILKQLGIEKYFDAIVDPSSLQKGKPDPEIFLKATSLLGLKTTEVVGIEDSIAGVDSINNANIFSIGVGDKRDLKEADIVVPNTENLSLNVIKKEFARFS
ncbi:beta-phosphoglucomutase [Aerococcus urinae]